LFASAWRPGSTVVGSAPERTSARIANVWLLETASASTAWVGSAPASSNDRKICTSARIPPWSR